MRAHCFSSYIHVTRYVLQKLELRTYRYIYEMIIHVHVYIPVGVNDFVLTHSFHMFIHSFHVFLTNVFDVPKLYIYSCVCEQSSKTLGFVHISC